MSGGNFLTPKEQIEHCIDKGISFNKISQKDAIIYLSNSNNYFKIRSFRKNYTKDSTIGKYTNLDFAELVDLAKIDNQLRYILLDMALDIEHFSKVNLLQILREENEDGYSIVKDYVNQLSDINKTRLEQDWNKNRGSIYCGNLYKKYINLDITVCPVWVFIEILSFGQYLYFYEFCAKRCRDTIKAYHLTENLYLMRVVKDLRNASAHNNCIINDLRVPLPPTIKANYRITTELGKIGLSKKVRKKHLKRAPLYHIIAVLYTHKIIVSSKETHKKTSQKLQELSERLYKNNTYANNDIITSTFNILKVVIDNWFRLG